MQHINKTGKRIKAKCKRLGVATLLTCIFTLSTVMAQESVNAAGGNALGSGGAMSYSVGQVFYATNSGTNGSVVQGIQQPYEISAITGIVEAKGISLSVSAYPNPTTDYLQLKVESGKWKDLNYLLFDMNGKLLQSEKITEAHTSISMSNFMPATYFLKVMRTEHDLSQEIKTFKIIKK